MSAMAASKAISSGFSIGWAAGAPPRHPVAEAPREKFLELDLQLPPCDETEYRIGLGVEGRVNGDCLHVDSARILRQSDIRVDHIDAKRAAIDKRGCSRLYVALDGQLAGLIAYEDSLRPLKRGA